MLLSVWSQQETAPALNLIHHPRHTVRQTIGYALVSKLYTQGWLLGQSERSNNLLSTCRASAEAARSSRPWTVQCALDSTGNEAQERKHTYHGGQLPCQDGFVEIPDLFLEGVQRYLQTVPQLTKVAPCVAVIPIRRSRKQRPEEQQEGGDEERPQKAAGAHYQRRLLSSAHL